MPTSTITEIAQQQLSDRWTGGGVTKIQIIRRPEYGWVLWVFVERRPVPLAAYDLLPQITYDAVRMFSPLQCVQVNEMPVMCVRDVIRCAALVALL